ncbi:MAG: glutathione peroxidase [Bacteriovorax sp.]|nr:glutathione peroxidase [Bacteriovorax sp.]
MDSKIAQIEFKDASGNSKTLSDYGDDKVIMVVNVASKCGLTPQYAGLEKIYEKYQDQGFIIVGFPANEFAGQEPGTNAEIQEFCQINYGLKFPVAQKVIVKGEGQHPLFELLTEEKPVATMRPGGVLEAKLREKGLITGKAGDIMWNFEKFLLDKQGNVVERFAPDIVPEDPMVIHAIESALRKS